MNLNPAGALNSFANGVYHGQQVGFAVETGGQHAVLWSGNAAGVVDLNPMQLAGISQSDAYATDGLQQVGYGSGSATGSYQHALLWSGTAASAVDLNASGMTQSFAYGVGGGQQVGQAQFGSITSAVLWTGTADSAINLDPLNDSGALAANGVVQVGYQDAELGQSSTAMLWSGSADSAVNLQLLLPSPDTWTSTVAYDFDASGDIFGLGVQGSGPSATTYAVEWSPVPEPTSIASAGLVPLLMKRRCRRVAD